jgi:hypothetical protein
VIEKLMTALEAEKWEDATWHAQAILRLNGVSRLQSSIGSTRHPIPLSAADLPTLLGMLLETQTLRGVSEESTWRSRLKSLVKSLPDSSTRDSMNGQQQAQRASGQTQGKRYLPSKRKYWPGEAKDVFWDLVRALNKYDKEHAPGGTKSPIQLDVAEEATRRWWEMEHGYRLSP